MLWSKAWLETRARFLISLVGIFVLCSFSVFHGERQAEPWVDRSYYNYVLSEGHAVLVVAWALAVTLLMMGGLLREQALGSASFTLGLPVSRQKLMAVRVAMGLFQALSLAIVPWCAMYLIAAILGKAFSPSQVAFHVLLLLSGGAVFFAVALLVSSVVTGEYTAPVVSFGILLAITVTLGDQKTRLFSPLAFMNGTQYFNRHTYLLVGPFPWQESAIWLCVSAFLTWIAVRAISRRDI